MWFSPRQSTRNRWRAGYLQRLRCGPLSIDYYDLGYQAGTMAYDILANGTDITTKEVEYAPNVSKLYNVSVCEQLGITVPDDYTALETEV